MKNKFLFNALLVLGVLLSTGSLAQNFMTSPDFLKANSHWAFGQHAGLNFNTGSPVSVRNNIRAEEGPSSIAHPVTGNLMFYTNGEKIRNVNGDIMPNGDSLLGNSNHSYLNYDLDLPDRFMSTNQGTCIVPVIGSTDQYYVFSLASDCPYYPRRTTYKVNYALGSLFYSVVDMGLDEGLGDIVHGQKNVALTHDTLAEAMVAVPGNNCDIWLLVHARFRQEIHAYRISAAGIDTTPVISTIGTLPITGQQTGAQLGLAISPDRRYLARVGGLYAPNIVAHFDATTGQVSDVVQLPGGKWAGRFAVAFSPDNSKLYIDDDPYGLGQFDISVYDSAAIASSLVSLISPFSGGYSANGDSRGGYLRLYNDTIYFRHGSGTNASSTTIHRIKRPNLSGTACGIQFNALQLLPGTNVDAGFGSDVVFPLPGDTSYLLALDTLICSNAEIVLTSPQTLDTIQWSDGSSNEALSVTQAGIYWVKQSNGCRYRVDTFIVDVIEFAEPVIVAYGLELRVSAVYSSYQWLLDGNIIPNATGAAYMAQVSGDYQVIAGNAKGCVDTSAIYTMENVSIHGLEESTALIAVYPNPVDEVLHIQSLEPVDIQLSDVAGRKVMELQHTKEISMKALQAGVYILQIKNIKGGLLQTIKIVKR